MRRGSAIPADADPAISGYSADQLLAIRTGSSQGLYYEPSTGAWRRAVDRPDKGAPAGSLGETLPRGVFAVATSALTNGTVRYSGVIWLNKGETVTNIVIESGTTALTPGASCHQYAALIDPAADTRLALSNDLGTAAWGAQAEQTFPLSTPYTPADEGYVGVAVLIVTATTPPSLLTVGSGSWPHLKRSPKIGYSADTGQTGIPATLTPGNGNSPFYARLT